MCETNNYAIQELQKARKARFFFQNSVVKVEIIKLFQMNGFYAKW